MDATSGDTIRTLKFANVVHKRVDGLNLIKNQILSGYLLHEIESSILLVDPRYMNNQTARKPCLAAAPS